MRYDQAKAQRNLDILHIAEETMTQDERIEFETRLVGALCNFVESDELHGIVARCKVAMIESRVPKPAPTVALANIRAKIARLFSSDDKQTNVKGDVRLWS